MRCLGKLPARHDPRTLRLARYLSADLPDVPAARDWSEGTVWDDDDNGCVMLDVFKHWRNVGICGVRIEAFVALDPNNLQQLTVACELFGGVHLGLNLPQSAQEQEIWDDTAPASPPWGGHAVYAPAISPGLLVVDTGGDRRPLTPEFLFRYCDEAYAVFHPDLFPVGSGLDVDRLRYDLGRLA